MTHTVFLMKDLGYCTKCIRKAFLTAAGAWCLVALLAMADSPKFWYVGTVLAIGLTTLWLAHILAFARKSIFTSSSRTPNPVALSRRALWPFFLRAAASAALASAVSRAAFAESPCGGWPDQGLSCGPCQRRNTVSSPCEDCHSCGQNCQGNC
jgi:hypothetical protein